MELKVWVEGIQRIVCGVTVNTTCQDVVFALAHATGATGRFTLIERWRNNERLLAPHENPLKLLLKWGEYANDVQFILQRSENRQQSQQQQHQQQQQAQALNHISNNLGGNADTKTTNISNTNNINNNNNSRNVSNNNSNQSSIDSTYNVQLKQQQQQQQQQQKQQTNAIDYNFNTHHYDKSKALRKSFGSHDMKTNENVGIVRGIPQQNNAIRTMKSPTRDLSPQRMQISPPLQQQQQYQQQQQQPHLMPRHEKSQSNPIEMPHTHNNSNNNRMLDNYTAFYNNSNSNNINNNNNNIYNQIGAQNSKSINEINLAEVRNALDRRVTNSSNQAESMEIMFSSPNGNNNSNSNHSNNNNNNDHSHNNSSSEHLLDVYNGNIKYNNASPDLYKNSPTISANGALVPPPYRNPPPPRNSPQQHQTNLQHSNAIRNTNPFLNDYTGNSNNNNQNNNVSNSNDSNFEFQNFGNANNTGGVGGNTTAGFGEESESIFQASQYSDLLQLIKYQRDKISSQQTELNKYDAEISFLETKERDQAQELEAIAREITKADQIYRQGSEQLQTLQYVEEENELVKQQEKTLKSEIALLRSKLANCETELLQCKNKMRLLMDDIEMEQRDISNMQKTNRQNVERDFLMEMERIQSEIDQAIHNADTTNKTAENLKKEISMIENAIADKKRQLEQLINEMKEVNLQSLTVTTSEEIKHLLEGPNKPGSTRRIIGSPRQLENAVPTSKNPHGVWV